MLLDQAEGAELVAVAVVTDVCGKWTDLSTPRFQPHSSQLRKEQRMRRSHAFLKAVLEARMSAVSHLRVAVLINDHQFLGDLSIHDTSQ